MYQIGDRRFPEIANLYEDPRGKEPREVSDAPIQMVHQVNAGGNDLVIARADYNPGGGAYPAAWTAVTFTFANGTYAAQALLPDDRIWKIIACGAACVAAAPYVSVEPIGFSGVIGWTGLTRHPRWVGNVDPTPEPNAIDGMTGLVLPYGGVVWTRRAAVDTGRLICYAVGWPRAMTPPA